MGLIIEIIFIIVLIILGIFNFTIRITYKNMKEINNESNLSGFEIARILSSELTSDEPHIIKKNGKFLDYYDANRNVIKLSPEVFDGTDMYAAVISLGLASLVSKERRTKVNRHNVNNFLVVLSYVMIVIGALLNNYNVIYFGMSLFIIAFIFQILLLNTWGKSVEEMEDVYNLVQEKELIKPYSEEDKINIAIVGIFFLARLPYGFINNFR